LEPQSLNKRFASSTPDGRSSRSQVFSPALDGEGRPSRHEGEGRASRHSVGFVPDLYKKPFTESKRQVVNDSPAPRDHVSWPKDIRRPDCMDGIPDSTDQARVNMHARRVTFVNEQPTLCRTDIPYVVKASHDDSEEEEKEVHLKKRVQPDSEPVVVPGFRIHKVPTGFSMEGTENLDDETYNKRHQKFEQDEKRRKRWDAQEMREQSLYERLRKQQSTRVSYACGSSSGSSREDQAANLESFLPDPYDAEYIEVSDEVPVSAFGFPLLSEKPSDFDISWFDLDKRDTSEKYRAKERRRKR